MKVSVYNRANSSAPDENLIAAAKDGDMEAFGVLFERYKDSVYCLAASWVGSGSDAEDIVQETFCSAWRSVSSFRGDARLMTWLYRIATNLCSDHGRRCKRLQRLGTRTDVEAGDLTAYEGPGGDPENESVRRQMVTQALDTLGEFQRSVVILCDMHGFAGKDAAEVLGCSPVSVRVGLHYARKRLRKLLSDMLSEDE